MYLFSLLDNRTLIACDFMLAVAFAIVFFSMKRAYPILRGINTIGISFLLGVPGTLLLASRGEIPKNAASNLSISGRKPPRLEAGPSGIPALR